MALAPGSLVDRFLPRTLPAAVELGLSAKSERHGGDVSASTSAYLRVKVAEGALLPTVTFQAAVQQSYEQSLIQQPVRSAPPRSRSSSVPIYQGGAEYSLIRQSRETLAQQRLALEQARDQTRANVVAGMGTARRRQAQVAVRPGAGDGDGNRVERRARGSRAGRRTTLDVLNARRALVDARVALVTAQHDRVVASYTLRAGRAVGRLSPRVLEPADHGLVTRACTIIRCARRGRRAYAGRPLISRSQCSSHSRD